MCNHSIYTLEDADMLNFPSICSFLRDHGAVLPFDFSELDNSVMKNFNIEKPVVPPLEVVKVGDASTSRVGHVTAMSATFQ